MILARSGFALITTNYGLRYMLRYNLKPDFVDPTDENIKSYILKRDEYAQKGSFILSELGDYDIRDSNYTTLGWQFEKIHNKFHSVKSRIAKIELVKGPTWSRMWKNKPYGKRFAILNDKNEVIKWDNYEGEREEKI